MDKEKRNGGLVLDLSLRWLRHELKRAIVISDGVAKCQLYVDGVTTR